MKGLRSVKDAACGEGSRVFGSWPFDERIWLTLNGGSAPSASMVIKMRREITESLRSSSAFSLSAWEWTATYRPKADIRGIG